MIDKPEEAAEYIKKVVDSITTDKPDMLKSTQDKT
jgi:hypothetical protein